MSPDKSNIEPRCPRCGAEVVIHRALEEGTGDRAVCLMKRRDNTCGWEGLPETAREAGRLLGRKR